MDVLVLVSGFLLLVFVQWWIRGRSRQLPPGPKPLPLIGNLLDFTLKELWLRVNTWADKYGGLLCLFQRDNVLRRSGSGCRGCGVSAHIRSGDPFSQHLRGDGRPARQTRRSLCREAVHSDVFRAVSISLSSYPTLPPPRPIGDRELTFYSHRCGCEKIVRAI